MTRIRWSVGGGGHVSNGLHVVNGGTRRQLTGWGLLCRWVGSLAHRQVFDKKKKQAEVNVIRWKRQPNNFCKLGRMHRAN